MKIYKVKAFYRWQKSEKVTEEALIKAVTDMENVIFEANLGGNIYKLEVQRAGFSKRRSHRTIVATKLSSKTWFFLYGFSKKDRANISELEEDSLKDLANDYLSLTQSDIDSMISQKFLFEVEIKNETE
jgi:hypothetical protein